AGEEQDETEGERGDDRPLLVRQQRGRDERPRLLDHDRRGEEDPDDERQLQRNHEGLRRAERRQLAVGKVRSHGLDQEPQHVELHDQPEADAHPYQERDQAPEDAHPQLLQMVEERHLRRSSRLPAPQLHGHSGSSTWFSACTDRARRALSSRSSSTNSSMSWKFLYTDAKRTYAT